MTPELVIHITQRAEPAQAAWLVRLLAPVAAVCRFEIPPPLEIRPTGRWGGWALDRRSAPDRRVCMSSRFCFWTRDAIVEVYLHEAAHQLLEGARVRVDAHGGEFFSLNAILLIRSAQFFSGDALGSLTLYDFQDCPESLADAADWRGVVLDWALPVAVELAATDASAEDLAPVVCARWKQFIDDRQAAQLMAQRVAVRVALQAQRRVEELEDLRSSRWLWRVIAMVGWVPFFFLVWVVWRGFK